MYQSLPHRINEVARLTVDAAYAVHKALGPGLLESVYGICLSRELARRDIRFEREVALPLVYDGIRLESGFRLDLLVEKAVVVELKAVDALLPLHCAQLLTYLKLSGYRLGLLINFNVPIIKNGIKRIIL